MYKLTALTALCLIWCLPVPAQYHPFPIVSYKGDENISQKGKADHSYERVQIPNQSIFTNIFVFEMHNIADYYTGIDIQSQASPQQLWYDFPTGTLNAVFMTSQQSGGFSDRTSTYFFSTDAGVTWSIVGHIPPPFDAISGFPAIIGLSSGKIVIANHTHLGGSPTRTQLFINSAAGQNDFINYDPGTTPDGNPLWPKLGKSNNDLIFFASASNPDPLLFLNSFDPVTGTFSGYSVSAGRQPEGYSFSTSNEGKVGFAFLDSEGAAWFSETTDDGVTWSSLIKIFEPFLKIENGDTVLHATIRGINIAYIDESPKVVFEVYRWKPDLTNFFYRLPSEIYFWSPDVNNGNAFIIADSSKVPFYPNQGITAVDAAINRPVIGKAIGDGALFVAFYASSEFTHTTPDSTRFMAGYFMMSDNGGITWTNPERFTPVTNPPLDWRWISIAPVNPVTGNSVKVHIVSVGDPIAGPYYSGPPFVTAQFFHFSADITLTNVSEEPERINSFNLSQNYPNPFNPSTTIGYQIPDAGYITLKIYDVLGNEISTLVDEFKPAGKYEVSFDASSGSRRMASGVYYYQLRTDKFIQTKKMLLIR